MSLLLPSSEGTSFVFNLMDTPGHVNFIDEVASALRLADGVVLVIDAIEGVMANTEKIIKLTIQEQLPLTLVVNKVDRLILELKLPPNDAYYKLRLTIEEVNNAIKACGSSYRVSPELGNVCFASFSMGWCFSLESFSRLYFDHFDNGGNPAAAASRTSYKDFAKRLWGDVYFNQKTRKFAKSAVTENFTRSFVHFILEPIYKLYAQVVGEETSVLQENLTSVGIALHKSNLKLDVKPLLKVVAEEFFGSFSAFTDMCISHIPDPHDAAQIKASTY